MTKFEVARVPRNPWRLAAEVGVPVADDAAGQAVDGVTPHCPGIAPS
jgi:hypothetical protein